MTQFTFGKRPALLVAAFGFVLIPAPTPVLAASAIAVNVQDDLVGDTCPSTCSVRAAIVKANGDSGDTISVPSGTYKLAQGQLVATSAMTISGAGSATTIIDGNNLSRVLQVGAGGILNMSGVTVQHGSFVASGINRAGGGIEVLGKLTLSNSAVRNNTVAITNQVGDSPTGGGISGDNNTSVVTLTNVVVDGNKGSADVSALVGGGVGSRGTLVFNGGVVSNNVASFKPGDGLGEGGGIAINNGATTSSAATMDSLDIHDNTSGGGGGVVDESGPATLTRSTLRSNHARSTNDFGGGWLANGNGDTLINVTVSNNDSVAGGGGVTDFTGGSTLLNDTIANNSSVTAGGGLLSGTLAGTTSVQASILAANTPNNCGLNQGGTITSKGSNIDSGTTCKFGAAADKSSTNPALGALAANGGPAPTLAISAGSPALDADFTTCPPPATDERGIARPQGVRCDIGAFELQVAAAITPSPAPTPVLPRAGVPRGRSGLPILVLSVASLLIGGVASAAWRGRRSRG